MKIMAINGSPRRAENTARLLHKALEGAASLGAETEYIDLYPLKYKGCLSCFYCKRKDKEHGVCIVKDDLAPVLERAKQADALLFGSPIYFMNLTSGMQTFLERFFFSQYIYSREIPSVLGKTLPSAFLYTMNATEEQADAFHLKDSLAAYERAAAGILGVKPYLFYDSTRCNSRITANTSLQSSPRKRSMPITRSTVLKSQNRHTHWARN